MGISRAENETAVAQLYSLISNNCSHVRECSVVEETTISKREVGGSNPSTGSTYSVAYSVSNS